MKGRGGILKVGMEGIGGIEVGMNGIGGSVFGIDDGITGIVGSGGRGGCVGIGKVGTVGIGGMGGACKRWRAAWIELMFIAHIAMRKVKRTYLLEAIVRWEFQEVDEIDCNGFVV
ncbi:hypothetical protein QJS10_CPA06g02132 [Acorus calamus]|uniref:Uncharacterized protein n=1 Tax=Acorus calamus TaxID=4465 RepID=A0AAV9EPU2_ACOCL|nr:hypothetical protein QJS10_CPA06g02132 [Acorus calamus]